MLAVADAADEIDELRLGSLGRLVPRPEEGDTRKIDAGATPGRRSRYNTPDAPEPDARPRDSVEPMRRTRAHVRGRVRGLEPVGGNKVWTAIAWAAVAGLAACRGDGAAASQGAAKVATCWPTDPSCKLTGGAGFECLSLHDNGVGDRGTYRMSQLEIAKPLVLAGRFLQDTVTTREITLEMPQCLQDGTGRFNWLFDADWASGELRTGGAHIPSDPAAGYCFIDGMVSGFLAQPVQIALQMGQDDAGRTFATKTPIASLSVPIYLDDAETTSLLLPLHDVQLSDGHVSADNDCIGSWDGDGLSYDNNCEPNAMIGQHMQWLNGARLTAYITGEEADRVWIPQLQQTLCVALSGDAQTYGQAFVQGTVSGKRCARDMSGRILALDKADWCSSTSAACSPPDADAFRLEAGFAASAVLIRSDCAAGAAP